MRGTENPDAVFVYEILWWVCICGSWRNKGLNEEGNGNQQARTRVYTRIPLLTVGSPDPDLRFHA